MSLCFREAFLDKIFNKISEEEYLNHLIAHFRGVRHPLDSGTDPIVEVHDPIGRSFKKVALRADNEPLEGK
jgi:hypothetical protein